MKQTTFTVVLILWFAMIAGVVPYAADPAHSWSPAEPMLEGISQAQLDAYRFGGYGYQGGGYCGPMYQGPPAFGYGIGAGGPPVQYPRSRSRRRAPALKTCE